LSLLLDAWTLFLLIVSTFNMYRPLFCVCYSSSGCTFQFMEPLFLSKL